MFTIEQVKNKKMWEEGKHQPRLPAQAQLLRGFLSSSAQSRDNSSRRLPSACLLIDVALSPLFEQLSGDFFAPFYTWNLEVRQRRAWTKTAWLGKGTGGT